MSGWRLKIDYMENLHRFPVSTEMFYNDIAHFYDYYKANFVPYPSLSKFSIQSCGQLPLPKMMNIMIGKKIGLILMFCWFSTVSQAQLPAADKSPMDMSYAPHNYPILKFQDKTTSQPLARVIYSRPQKNGRELFGKELKYGTLWRVGANEATEISFYSNAIFGGKKVAKGRYTLFCIPNENNWILILNKDTDSWGGFSYKQSNDVLRITVPVTSIQGYSVEHLTIYFNAANNLIVAWDNVQVTVPISFTSTR